MRCVLWAAFWPKLFILFLFVLGHKWARTSWDSHGIISSSVHWEIQSEGGNYSEFPS